VNLENFENIVNFASIINVAVAIFEEPRITHVAAYCCLLARLERGAAASTGTAIVLHPTAHYC
jgi:hypothetical protein